MSDSCDKRPFRQYQYYVLWLMVSVEVALSFLTTSELPIAHAAWSRGFVSKTTNMTTIFVPAPVHERWDMSCSRLDSVNVCISSIQGRSIMICSDIALDTRHAMIAIPGSYSGPLHVSGYFTFPSAGIRFFSLVAYGVRDVIDDNDNTIVKDIVLNSCEFLSGTEIFQLNEWNFIVTSLEVFSRVYFKRSLPPDTMVSLFINNIKRADLYPQTDSLLCGSMPYFDISFSSRYYSTYFIEVRPSFPRLSAHRDWEALMGNYRVVELVPSVIELDGDPNDARKPKLRHFSTLWIDTEAPRRVGATDALDRVKHHVCMYFDVTRPDGMKEKMLNFLEAVDRDAFEFTFFGCQEEMLETVNVSKSLIMDRLKKMSSHVTWRPCLAPLMVSEADMRVEPNITFTADHNIFFALSKGRKRPEDGAFESYLQDTKSPRDLLSTFEYALLRLERANFDLDRISPPFTRSIWDSMLRTIRSAAGRRPCEALVFGNDGRAITSVLAATARLLKIPSILEMPNLFTHSMSRADFVIVESKFGFSHPSVQTLVSNSKPPVREVVIVPYGIDIAARQALALEGGGAYYCPSGCGYSPPPTETSHYREGFRLSRRCGRCIVVGLISRLAEEKSVALFLYACAELVLHDPFYRCVIVGEGQLRGNLEDLTRRLGIAANVEFKGWVENRAIPMIVLSFDIAVTTGAWEETFSIVGLEHLGLGVPLVTFAAGGMGEYIADPHKNPSEQSLVLTFIRNLRLNCGIVNGTLPFMVSLNAIVVIRPETCALSAAIMFLNQHDSIRDRNAANGIRLVHQHFNREKFVSVYQQLLKRAVTEKYYYE